MKPLLELSLPLSAMHLVQQQRGARVLCGTMLALLDVLLQQFLGQLLQRGRTALGVLPKGLVMRRVADQTSWVVQQ